MGADQVSRPSHPLHGAWRYVDALLDGKSTRPNGKGIIYYAPSGDMVCQVSPGNEVKKAGAKPTPEEALAALDGHIAYFGTYSIDEQRTDRHAPSQGQRAAGRHRRPRAPVHDRRRSADAQSARHELRSEVGTDQVDRAAHRQAGGMHAFSSFALARTCPRHGRNPSSRKPAQTPDSDSDKLVGVWRLVSITDDGKVNPERGGKPTGYIFYTASGEMGAMIQPERAPIAMAGKAAEPAGGAGRAQGLHRLFRHLHGRREGARSSRTTARRSVQPGYEADVLRRYRFEPGDRLVLGNPGAKNALVWERIK